MTGVYPNSIAFCALAQRFTRNLRTGLSTGSTLQYPLKTHYLVCRLPVKPYMLGFTRLASPLFEIAALLSEGLTTSQAGRLRAFLGSLEGLSSVKPLITVYEHG